MTSASATTTSSVPPSTPSSSTSTTALTSSSNSNNSNSASAAAATPTPVRHNYANPHTPIASVKRPRSSAATTNNNATSKLSPLHPPRPVSGRSIVETEEDPTDVTSPPAPVASLDDGTPESNVTTTEPVCHNDGADNGEADPASTTTTSTWVGRQVDALFSPVLNFLHHNSGHHRQNDQLPTTPTSSCSEEEDVAAVTDEDVTMDDVAERESTPSSSPSKTSHEHTPPAVVTMEDDPVVVIEPKPEDHHHHVADPSADTSAADTSADLEDEDEFNPYLFIKSLPPYELVAPFRPPIALPPKQPQAPPISLILDLDETLVHCSVEGTCIPSSNQGDPPPPPDLIFPVLFHGMTYQVQVRLRPHLFTFLEAIAQKFEVVVFTASQKVYADELLNLLDPENKFIHHRLFRESCLPVEGNFLKDLNVLGRDLRQTVLVDNSPHAFGYQIDNGIPIESWFEDPNDSELLKLEQFLINQLLGTEDVRSVVRQQFQTFLRVEQA